MTFEELVKYSKEELESMFNESILAEEVAFEDFIEDYYVGGIEDGQLFETLLGKQFDFVEEAPDGSHSDYEVYFAPEDNKSCGCVVNIYKDGDWYVDDVRLIYADMSDENIAYARECVEKVRYFLDNVGIEDLITD